ncbi:DUF5709 domain-containing protein [Nocardioides sp. SR21]|uniref:DUF5709 domain-containing protein n=1 Tax=Nocardioides sp. SR21 TaxID=2919501 RepID=UPI001FA99523|nr:DUF5709 domain-containing protein [Nocardioides sp. SR21]
MSHGDGDQEIYGDYSVDDEDQPGNIEDLGDADVADPLDRGYSPPEKWSAGQGYGNTPWEEEHRETIDQRIGQEEPDVDPYDDAADLPDDDQVGDLRAGRLVGTTGSDEFAADDVGIDDGAASAEEAAIHVVEDLDDE